MLRRFQFSLRTLLIVVALLALPCAYVGWEAKIVAQRKSWLEAHPDTDHTFPPGLEPGEISWVRRWLGDEERCQINVRGFSQDELETTSKLFPEATQTR